MKNLLFVLVAMPLLALAQGETGIKFEQDLSWQQVLAKAKAENKYIFVDCYATWCGPCKEMDKNVYPQAEVGAFVNDKFVSVKVQMDTTPKDSAYVKSWRTDAKSLQDTYKLAGYPSYLFFSPQGKIVHRATGQMSPSAFIRTAGDAADPSKQLYTALDNYRQGKKDYKTMAIAARAAGATGDKELAAKIAEDYKTNHLDKLSDAELLTKENIVFIKDFPKLLTADGSKGRFFKFFYNEGAKVDEYAGRKGTADHYVRGIITKEEVTDKLWRDEKPITKNPDWQAISAAITQRYSGEYARTIVPDAKLNFYRRIEDWNKFVELIEEKMRQTPPQPKGTAFGGSWGDAWAMNGFAWDIFLNCTDKQILNKALEWSDLSMKLEEPLPNVQYWDTKANLLYKLGRVEEAIALEQKALDRVNEEARKAGKDKSLLTDEYVGMIDKMKKGLPTWQAK